MSGQCSPENIQKVTTILEAVHELNQGGNRSELLQQIKTCAHQTNVTPEIITSTIENISGISVDDLEPIVAAIPTPTPPASGTPPATTQPQQPQQPQTEAADEFEIDDRVKIIKAGHDFYNREGVIREIVNDTYIRIKLDNDDNIKRIKKEYLKKLSTRAGGKHKSKKNKSKKSKTKKSKSKKSKSKKRRSKRRKHRKMRRTRR